MYSVGINDFCEYVSVCVCIRIRTHFNLCANLKDLYIDALAIHTSFFSFYAIDFFRLFCLPFLFQKLLLLLLLLVFFPVPDMNIVVHTKVLRTLLIDCNVLAISIYCEIHAIVTNILYGVLGMYTLYIQYCIVYM